MTYSNRLLLNAELVETFEYSFPRAARPAPSSRPSNAEAAADERMKRHLASLAVLEADVEKARARLDQALSDYNQLR